MLKDKLYRVLKRTRGSLSSAFLLLSGQKITVESLEEIEEMLITADMGYDTVEEILEIIRMGKEKDRRESVIRYLTSLLPNISDDFNSIPTVYMIVGVNGTGKTTSTAKLGNYFKEKGKSVTLIGADTYRAAAVAQLKIWSQRTGIRLICNEKTSEPGSVLFDGMQSAVKDKSEVIIIDTAGRLHTTKNLMIELEKMYRILSKHFSEFPIFSFLIIDAGLGQNSLIQAREFQKYIRIDGAILTKLDGTAKGGIIFPLYKELQIPIRFIGTGEKLDDIAPFNRDEYVKGLFY